MRVIDLQVMLHHYYLSSTYPFTSPAMDDAHVLCVSSGLLVERPYAVVQTQIIAQPLSPSQRAYNITEKGRVFVDALRSVPLPVQAWRIPIPDERKS